MASKTKQCLLLLTRLCLMMAKKKRRIFYFAPQQRAFSSRLGEEHYLYSCCRHHFNYNRYVQWKPSLVSIDRNHVVELQSENITSQLDNATRVREAHATEAPTMAEHGAADDVVVLRCFDGEEFRVPSALARRSGAVAAGIDSGEHAANGGAVPVPGGVAGRVLAAVITYWMSRDAIGAADHGRYDVEYAAGLSHDVRVDVIHAAFHLRERTLFDLFVPAACSGVR